MLTELCQELRNWFERDKVFGTFTIENGELDVPDGLIQDGQYYRIINSVFNDGVHQYKVQSEPTVEEPAVETPAGEETEETGTTETTENTSELIDEVFEGAIWLMAVPPAVIALSGRIDDWKNQYGSIVSSPYSSESFGGYSYQKAGAGRGNTNSNDSPTWQSTFASELNKWRKI